MRNLNSRIVAVVSLAASTLSLPSRKHTTFCLEDITYNSSVIYSTPAHLAVAQGQVSFNLVNSAVPYATHCSAFSVQPFDFFYGEVVYQCDAVPDVVGSTNFTFSEPDGVFAVNSTWSCGEGSETILGYGTGTAALDCSTNTYTNPNWTVGDIYSTTTTTCQPAELQITPKLIE